MKASIPLPRLPAIRFVSRNAPLCSGRFPIPVPIPAVGSAGFRLDIDEPGPSKRGKKLRNSRSEREELKESSGSYYTGADGHKYCSGTNRRRVLCVCQSCQATNKGGSAICEHGRQKHKCKQCGGKSLCEEHQIQKNRCVQCFKDGKSPSGLCVHGREKLLFLIFLIYYYIGR